MRKITKKLPHGITVRNLKTCTRIQIAFTYQGKNYRELLKIEATPENIELARKKRDAVLLDIQFSDKFDYGKHFPNSPIVKRAQNSHSTLMSELFETKLKGYENREKKGSLSISTFHGYRKILNKLTPFFGKYRVKDVKAIDIKNFIISEGGCAKTLRSKLNILNEVLDEAFSYEIIEKNPLNRDITNRLLREVADKSNDKIMPFSDEEVATIIENTSGQMRNLIQFGFWSGIRTGELIALTWDDINFENETVSISRSKAHNTIKAPKTNAGIRTIPLFPLAKEALLLQKKYTGKIGKEVFHNPNTNKPWSSSNKLGDHWHKTVKAIKGVKYRYCYAMRHTFASHLVSKGESNWLVADILGHENPQMLIKHYGTYNSNNKDIRAHINRNWQK